MPKELRIIDLFERPIDRHIEEVIKVEQSDEQTVHDELSEYVVTESMRDSFIRILDRYLETPNHPHEGIGIWISGFFGSGKSSFAKVLGYVLEDRRVLGDSATELFLQRVPHGKASALLRTINEKIPTRAVILDMATDRGVRTGSEKITEVMYKALLARLGYCTDLDLADLEIALEKDGRLERFEKRYAERYRKDWRESRDLIALSLNEASAVLHDIDPSTYPAADSWAKTKRGTDITPNTFAARAQELLARRAPGSALIFVVDEAGQYAGRSTDKMLDLQGVVEALGRVGRGKAWVAVTSQERLDEVLSNLDGTRVEFAKLRDRFPMEVDLRPEDISEVASKRVLTKKAQHEAALRELYENHKGALGTHTSLKDLPRASELDMTRFVRMYPFLPYHIDLIISIISGLRMQGGAMRQVSGSSRTIIKLAQQMIIHPEVNLGSQGVGRLVTLDMVYNLIRGNISHERKLDMAQIQEAYGASTWEVKVAKAICLLEFAKRIPRTAENIAAVLYPAVGAAPVLKEVQEALSSLERAQKVREAEDGWELLSVEGKRWEVERQGFMLAGGTLNAMKKGRAEEAIKGVGAYRHRNIQNFSAELHVNGEKISGKDGDIPLRLVIPVEGADLQNEADKARELSRHEPDAVYWLAPLNGSTYRAMTELHRSDQMINKYGREKLTGELARLFGEERSRRDNLAREVSALFKADLLSGTLYSRGVERRSADYGTTVDEVVRGILADIVPKIYNKFELAAISVKGGEAESIVTSANLSGLPAGLYGTSGGLGLITQQGGTYTINKEAPCAAEVLAAITRSQDMTGKALETHFRSKPYGWVYEVVALIAAALLRGGLVELTYQGQIVRSVGDPGAREAFATVPAFRASGFAPRKDGPIFEDIVKAARAYEGIFGQQAPLEEAGLVTLIREALTKEQDALLSLVIKLARADLPGSQMVEELLATFRGICTSPSDAAIKAFAHQSDVLKDNLRQSRAMSSALTEETCSLVESVRTALQRAWPPVLHRRPDDEPLKGAAARLSANLGSPSWYDRLPELAQDANTLQAAYLELYRQAWSERAIVYQRAIEQVRSYPGFEGLPHPTQEHILAPLAGRSGAEKKAEEISTPVYEPSLDQLESLTKAVDTMLAEALARCAEATTPRPVVNIAAARFFGVAISEESELEAGLEALRVECSRLLRDGKGVMIS